MTRSGIGPPAISGRPSTIFTVSSLEPSSTTMTSHVPSSLEQPAAGAGGPAAAQVAEQLIQRWTDAPGLVVGGQDDRGLRVLLHANACRQDGRHAGLSAPAE